MADEDRTDPVADAIAALTTAARQESADFGEIACHVITAVAANVGGVEELLAGRPGSWEAEHVRTIMLSTVGDDHRELLRHRTEPIRLEFDVEGVWWDFGLEQLYIEAEDDLVEAADAAHLAMFAAVATAEERSRLDEIDANHKSKFLDPDFDIALLEEAKTIADGVVRRAEEAGHPLLASRDAADAVLVALAELRTRDMATYRAAYTTAAQQAVADRGLEIAVELLDVVAPESSDPYRWDDVGEWVHEQARQRAPLPMTGAPPDWSDGTPADALRRAGLTYTSRAQEVPA